MLDLGPRCLDLHVVAGVRPQQDAQRLAQRACALDGDLVDPAGGVEQLEAIEPRAQPVGIAITSSPLSWLTVFTNACTVRSLPGAAASRPEEVPTGPVRNVRAPTRIPY